ncbi:MAG: hypothetical protein QOE74_1379 [Mycobacterium sp.]|jgi:hypothetical protein|nr:hypothetical protein [Mycobacterium sp.]
MARPFLMWRVTIGGEKATYSYIYYRVDAGCGEDAER